MRHDIRGIRAADNPGPRPGRINDAVNVSVDQEQAALTEALAMYATDRRAAWAVMGRCNGGGSNLDGAPPASGPPCCDAADLDGPLLLRTMIRHDLTYRDGLGSTRRQPRSGN